MSKRMECWAASRMRAAEMKLKVEHGWPKRAGRNYAKSLMPAESATRCSAINGILPFIVSNVLLTLLLVVACDGDELHLCPALRPSVL